MALTRPLNAELETDDPLSRTSAIDENRYCQLVLFLNEGQTEEYLDKQLLDDASKLGLADLVNNDDAPLMSRHLDGPNRGSDAGSIANPYTLPSPISPYPSLTHSSPSIFWNFRKHVSSSRQSIASLSTGPTAYSISESEPRHSIADLRFSRRSLNLENIDRGFKLGLKNAISRIPNLRKRKPSVFSIPPSHTVSKFDLEKPNAVDSMQKRKRSTDVSTGCFLMSKDTLIPCDEGSVERSLASPRLSTMRSAQESQMQRYISFRQDLLKPILKHQNRVLNEMKEQHLETVEKLKTKNSERAIQMEERDLAKELTLVEELGREKQALQSRIRYMEGYFNTPLPEPSLESGGGVPQPLREFSKENRDRLRQRYHELANIDALHASKIKVLRDTQAKKSDLALKKFDQAIHHLQANHEHELRNLDARFQEQMDPIITWLSAKQERMKARWVLEEKIERKKLENETHESYGPLPELCFDMKDGSSLPKENEDQNCPHTTRETEFPDHKYIAISPCAA